MAADLQGAWQAAGTKLTMLPSGVEVQLDLPSVAALLSGGLMPAGLRGIALQFASQEGVALDELGEAEKQRWAELERFLVRESVTGLKLPGKKLQTYRIPLEDLGAGDTPPRMPRDDYLALRDMVLRIRTPKQVDVLARLAQAELERERAEEAGASTAERQAMREAIERQAEDAARVVERERRHTIEGWSTFRGLGGGGAARRQRQGVGRPPLQPADHLGAGGRARPRRRAAPAARSTARGESRHSEPE